MIDIGPLVAGGEARATVDAIGRACSEAGFFYVCMDQREAFRGVYPVVFGD